MWPADLEADASRLEAGAVSPGLMVFAGTAVAVLEQAPKMAASRVRRESQVPSVSPGGSDLGCLHMIVSAWTRST